MEKVTAVASLTHVRVMVNHTMLTSVQNIHTFIRSERAASKKTNNKSKENKQ